MSESTDTTVDPVDVIIKADAEVNEAVDALAAAIRAARAEGVTWAEVGEALGVTRQAVHARFTRQLRAGLTSRRIAGWQVETLPWGDE